MGCPAMDWWWWLVLGCLPEVILEVFLDVLRVLPRRSVGSWCLLAMMVDLPMSFCCLPKTALSNASPGSASPSPGYSSGLSVGHGGLWVVW